MLVRIVALPLFAVASVACGNDSGRPRRRGDGLVAEAVTAAALGCRRRAVGFPAVATAAMAGARVKAAWAEKMAARPGRRVEAEAEGRVGAGAEAEEGLGAAEVAERAVHATRARRSAAVPKAPGGARTGHGGACEGAFVSAESCNGIDDDCDGDIDEGLRDVHVRPRGVSAQRGRLHGRRARDVPRDGAGDADGRVQRGRRRLRRRGGRRLRDVRPRFAGGRRRSSIRERRSVPFGTVQAAIEFASSFRSVAKRVCVAAGPSCGATFTYPGPRRRGSHHARRRGRARRLRIDDVDALLELDDAARAANRTGRVFPAQRADVHGPRRVRPRARGSVSSGGLAAVRIEGARGVLLSNVTLRPGTWGGNAHYPIYVTDAQAEITRTQVSPQALSESSANVYAVRSELRAARELRRSDRRDHGPLPARGLYGRGPDNRVYQTLALSSRTHLAPASRRAPFAAPLEGVPFASSGTREEP